MWSHPSVLQMETLRQAWGWVAQHRRGGHSFFGQALLRPESPTKVEGSGGAGDSGEST